MQTFSKYNAGIVLGGMVSYTNMMMMVISIQQQIVLFELQALPTVFHSHYFAMEAFAET